MLSNTNYTDLRQIHEDGRSIILKGYMIEGKMPVIIKAMRKEAVNAMELARAIHDYEITRHLNIEGIVKPIKLEQTESYLALVMEDIGAVSLKEYIKDRSLDLLSFLIMGMQLAETLDRLHQRGIVHRNLKPENILIHPVSGRVFVTDFSSAVLLSSENRNTLFPQNMTGTPGYMPPEQTGRLNMVTDQRSDLYALGVVFYKLLTGRLPLQGKSPAQWVYAQITQIPEPPAKFNKNVPLLLSEIIMKLIAKVPENRYQSAYGLYWDLNECWKRLTRDGEIGFFPIARVDLSSRFQLPDKFYGRERELDILKRAYQRVYAGKTEMVLISGYAGVGKTMLITKGFKPAVMKNGFFIRGKFDQLKKNIPYAPFTEAFSSLIRRLMTKSREKLDKWRKRILLTLGRNGAVITEVIPELELVIGKQPPVDALPPKEAENRFLMVFRHFIKAFAWKGHPLVLFLDDLQWADQASMHLLKYLSQDGDVSALLVVGAFRENEVKDNQLLIEMLEEIDQKNSEQTNLFLMPLLREEVKLFVSDILHCEEETSATLAEEVYRKTGGNPFFIKQFLTMIHDEGLLFFNKKSGSWAWDLDAVQKLQPGEDVLELFLKKLHQLPVETLETMKLSACLGNSFNLEILAAVAGKSVDEIISFLMPAVQEGLVLTGSSQKGELFEFMHDRIQQAVDSLIPEEDKKKKHIAIGRILLENADFGGLDENILSIMDHFNRSLELLHDPTEKIKLAGYNLIAGRKVKTSAAYASAREYFQAGRALLPDNAWQHAYQLSYDLHLELAQAEYLSGNVKNAEMFFDMVIEKAGSELERADVYGLKVILYASRGKYLEAAQTGIRALANLGVKVPMYPGKLDYARELLLYKWNMRNRKIEDLIHIPEMKDPVQIKAIELMSLLSAVTLSSNPDLYGYIALKTGNHSVRYGNAAGAALGYFGYSFTAANVLGDYRAGDRFGRVCIQLAERYGGSSAQCVIYLAVGAFISHWVRHAKFGLEYMKKAAQSGLEAGNVLIIGYAQCFILEIRYLLGVSLEEIAEEIRKKSETAKRLKHENYAFSLAIYEQAVSILRGEKAGTLADGAKGFQKEKVLPRNEHDLSSLATFYFSKMHLHYLAGDYQLALAAGEKGQRFLESLLGFLLYAEYCFYYILVITALYEELSFWDQKRLWKEIKRMQSRMKKWSETCPENFQHKYLLTSAEIARVQQDRMQAMAYYDQAIRSARENGYFQNEALANELAGKFYLSQDMTKVARAYLLDACRGYQKWGALAKVKELMDRYLETPGEVFRDDRNDWCQEIAVDFLKTSSGDSETASSLEMYSIEKAVDHISEETDLNKLLESVLGLAGQSIGADRGYLILEKNGEMFIEASKDSNKGVSMIKTTSLDECHELSKSVIRYVFRTLETVVINGSKDYGIFAGDPYIAASSSRSIACLPLLFQGIPFGVLYFENSLIPGVFTPYRLEVLKLFSAHVACIKKIQSYLSKDTESDQDKACLNLTIDLFTERETDVLRLMAAGMSNKEIADNLKITINTVKGYIKNIYEKMGVNRRVQAVSRAKELKILTKN